MSLSIDLRRAPLWLLLASCGGGGGSSPMGGQPGGEAGGTGGSGVGAGVSDAMASGGNGGSLGIVDAAMDFVPTADATSGDLCTQMSCTSPPANACEGATLKTYYDPNGTCSGGLCSYRFTTQLCRYGCQGDHCLPYDGPDGGVPAPDGAPGDDCAQVQCTSRPPNQCDGAMLKTYISPMGTCSAGVCSYAFTMQTCPRGCKDGACIMTTCTPGSAMFTADVTDVASLATVGPLPALAGGAAYEIRSYMQVKDSYAGMPVSIYAPTAMTAVVATHYFDPNHDPADTAYKGEWGLTFDASCTTQVTFAHVRQVAQKISDATVANPDAGNADNILSHPVDVAAGEVIGQYLRGPGYFAWDFVVTDTNVTNAFINMPRFQDGQLKFLHARCPYDLYPQPMRQHYLDLLGTNNDPPKAGRKCGTVEHDKAGTAAGVWFHAPYVHGTPDEARSASGNPLSLFKAETDVVYVADLDGDTDKVGFLAFRIEPTNPTYRDPETITTSYCYERHVGTGSPATGWAFVQVVSNTQLQVAYATEGGCPATFPTAGARTYYR
jgi:hypothetical protein